jgi:hypothetical protein
MPSLEYSGRGTRMGSFPSLPPPGHWVVCGFGLAYRLTADLCHMSLQDNQLQRMRRIFVHIALPCGESRSVHDYDSPPSLLPPLGKLGL